MAVNQLTRLRYFQWQDTFKKVKPYVCYMDVPAGFPVQNFSVEWGKPETIHDVRGEEPGAFSLDKHGFSYIKHTFEVSSCDREAVETEYLPQVEAFLRENIPDVADLKIYTWRVGLLPSLGPYFVVTSAKNVAAPLK
jgi:hypothetical protein